MDVIELLDYLHGFSLVALLQGVRGWHVNAAGKTARIQPSLCHSAAEHEETQQVFEEPGGLLQRASCPENCLFWGLGLSMGNIQWKITLEFLKNFVPLELLRLGQQSTEFHDFVGSSMARLTTFCAPRGTSMIFLNIIHPMAVSRQYSKICIYLYMGERTLANILLSIQADIARDFAFSLHCKIGKLRSNVRWSGFLMVGLPGFVSNFSFCPRFLFRLAHFLTMVIILVIICCGHHEIMSSSIFPWSLRHCSHGHHPENDDHGHHPDFAHGRLHT